MVMALGTAIITEAFPPTERGRALGTAGVMVSLGVITGPTMGGLILGAASWHWIFFVNLPVGVIGILMVLRFVPANPPPGRQRFDLPGAVTLFAGLMAFLIALTLGQQIGFGEAQVLGLLAAAGVLIAIFVMIELRSPQPMIDPALFKNRLFSINLVTGFLTFLASSGLILLMPFYLEDLLGHAPRTVGLMMSVSPVIVALVAPIAGSLSDRVGTRPLIAVGLLLMVCGYLGLSTLSLDTTIPGYILRYAPIGLGVAIFQSPNNSAIMGNAPRQRLGVASGLLAMTRTIGQTTGIAVLGAFWSGRAAALSRLQGAEQATPATQVLALNQTVLAGAGLIVLGFILNLYALNRERKKVTR
jgi:EmrB/QacA subfamily drug resistance transporter